MNIQSFLPQKRKLMGPGPSNIHPRVLAALSASMIGHLDPSFIDMMDEVKIMLQDAFCTKNQFTLPISAPGSAGMEFCLVNLLEKGDKAIVCRNGLFGMRLGENVIRAGAEPIFVDNNWGQPVDLNMVEDTLKKNSDAAIICFVHAETSTGVRSDAKTIASLAQKHGVISVVDCVTSLAGIELKIDEWGIDAAYSGTQKCLSVPPGLSPVTIGRRALKKILNRKSKTQSWFLDLRLLASYWLENKKPKNKKTQSTRSYHHTAPVSNIYALHEGLVILHEEGLQQSYLRHMAMHQKLVVGLENLGLEMFVDKKYRLPQLNSVKIPSTIDDAEARKILLDEYQIEIGAGIGALAGKIWRIGLMGYSANDGNIGFCLNALKRILR